MDELRLGDIIDDYCIKCRRLTNHAIVSLIDGEVAKVRCRSCYHDHNYLKEIAPPSKKDLKKAELFNAVLAQADPAAAAATVEEEAPAEEVAAEAEPVAPAAKKTRGRVKKP
jgi:hypothetical protein